MKRKILSAMLLLALALGATQARALTIAVRQDGQNGAKTTLADAVAVAQSGDTIDIQQFTQDFDAGGGFLLNGVNLTCSAGTNATIKFTADRSGGLGTEHISVINGATIANVNLVGRGLSFASGEVGIGCYGPLNLNNVTIRDFNSVGLWLGNVPASADLGTGVVTANITNCYIFNTEAPINYQTTGTDTPLQPVVIDHCTLAVSPGGAGICVNLVNGTTDQPATSGFDGSNFTIKNTLFYSKQGRCVSAGDLDSGIVVPTLNVHYSYNGYINDWMRYWFNGGHNADGNGTDLPLGTGDMTMPYPAQSPFVDLANGDLRLVATSICVGAGENGTNIGAYQGAGVAVALHGDVIVRQDGQNGAYTNLTDAWNAADTNQTIEIQQFTQPFDVGDLDMSAVNIICTAATPATIKFSGWRLASVSGSLYSNLIFDGQNTGDRVFIQETSGIYDRCTFENCVSYGLVLFNHDGATVKLTNCLFYNNGTSALQITREWALAAPLGATLIDHCTMIAGAMFAIDLADSCNGLDLSNLTVTNTFLGDNGNGRDVAGSIATLAYHHSYDCFQTIWVRDWWTNGDSTALGTGDIQIHTTNDPSPFKDAAGGDFTPVNGSKLIGAGQNGSTIGAIQVSTVPVELSSFAID